MLFDLKQQPNYTFFYDAQEDTSIGVVLFLLKGHQPKTEVYSFCSGGDQNARGHQGYVGDDGQHRLNILEVQRIKFYA
jgi:naphthoate synthase